MSFNVENKWSRFFLSFLTSPFSLCSFQSCNLLHTWSVARTVYLVHTIRIRNKYFRCPYMYIKLLKGVSIVPMPTYIIIRGVPKSSAKTSTTSSLDNNRSLTKLIQFENCLLQGYLKSYIHFFLMINQSLFSVIEYMTRTFTQKAGP